MFQTTNQVMFVCFKKTASSYFEPTLVIGVVFSKLAIRGPSWCMFQEQTVIGKEEGELPAKSVPSFFSHNMIV